MAILQNANAITPASGFELKSARFDRGSSSYLSKSSLSGGSTTTGTQSWWFKRSGLSTDQRMWANYSGSSSARNQIGWQAADKLYIQLDGTTIRISTQVFRDPSAWYHIVCAWDSTQGAAANRLRVYINGEEITAWDTNSTISQNADLRLNNGKILIGQRETSSLYFDGYLAEFYQIDGYACPPSKFGETNVATGQWQPKNPTDIKKSVTFGTNGFYLPFSNDALATSITPTTASGAGTAHTFTPTETLSCDVLLVGGGGAGGRYHAGGGGAGGVVVGTGWSASASAHDVFVGAGGQSSTGWPSNPAMRSANGGNSSFLGQIAYGGGGGGSYQNVNSPNPYSAGNDGGSGGGADGGQYGGVVWDLSGGAATKGLLTLSGSTHGNVGGTSAAPYTHSAGGGGGAGGAGQNAAYPGNGGAGGAGVANSYQTGSNITYGGGGGGGRWAGTAGAGGAGGGGAGSGGVNGGNGGDGTNGLGGGGGGMGGNSNSLRGGHGGSGVVIIRYASSTAKASGGTITSYTSGPTTYQVHTFSTANSTEDPITTVHGDTKNERISNHSVTANGNAHIIGPKVGSSAITFDGTGDYLSVAQSSDFAPGTSDFTIEGWVYPISGTYAVILTDTCDQAASPPRAGIRFWVDVNGTIEFYASTVNSSTDTISYNSPSGTVALYKWQHLAAVRDGNIFRAYVDGVQVSTLTITATSNSIPAPGPLLLGRQVSNYARMNVDEYRFSNTCRYPNGTTFAPPTSEFTSDANTKLLIHSNTTMGSTTFTDSSSAGHTITANGVVKHVAPKIGTGMASFDGSGDYLTFNDGSTVPEFMIPGNGAGSTGGTITYETWVSFNTIPTNDTNSQSIYAQTYDNVSANYTRLTYDSGLKWRWRIYNSSDSLIMGLDAADTGLAVNTWYHVAFVMNGTNCKIYRDGVEKGSATMSGTPRTPNRAFEWARYSRSSGAGNYMNGYMDESRISSSARYTSSFTPSTTAFKDDKDTLLLMHMDGGGGIDPTTNLPTLPGQGTYFWDASTNAIFYGADGIPTNKSIINFPGNNTGTYLSVGNSSAFNFGTGDFTVECWMWATNTSHTSNPHVYALDMRDGTSRISLAFNRNSGQGFWGGDGWSMTDNWWPSLGAWNHIAMVRQSNTGRVYLNGVQQQTQASWNQNYSGTWTIHWGDKWNNDTNSEIMGKMDQIRISDSVRYADGTTFTPPTTPFTTDANTKLLIQSDFSEGGLGADHSNNYNYFTPTNLGVDDSMPDSPMNNFATWNPLAISGTNANVFSEGNLKSANGIAFGGIPTIGLGDSGKWYAEFLATSTGTDRCVGLQSNLTTAFGNYNPGRYTGSYSYDDDGQKYENNSGSSYGNTYTTGDIIGVAADLTNNKLYFSKNGTWQDSGDPTSGSTGTGAISISSTPADGYFFGVGDRTNNATWYANFGSDSSFAGQKTAQGNQDDNDKGDFYYAPPSGYLALCTDNLPDPSIALPEDYFGTSTWSALSDGSAQSISQISFQPDWVWIKQRNGTYDHMVFDSVRGATKYIESNDTTADQTDAQTLTSFNSDGFSLGTASTVNGPNDSNSYVGWAWKAGTTNSGSTSGSGTAKTYSSSTDATSGFSVIKYVGNGTSGHQIPHHMGVAPQCLMAKNLDRGSGAGSDWHIWHTGFGTQDKYIWLNHSNPAYGSVNYFKAVSSTTFSLGTDTSINANDEDIICYAFTGIEGYSKFGSYEGNNNADGTFIYTGFEPAFLIYKNIDATADWGMVDNKRSPYNTLTKYLAANENAAEITNSFGDFTSNGIKMRNTYGGANASNTYIYLAFAESPFKTSNAR